MVQLNRSMMERYEIPQNRPQTMRAALFGANQLMLGAAARLLDRANESGADLGALCVTSAAEALSAQDGMFTLLVRGENADGTPLRQERVVQSILRCLNPETEFEALLAAAAEPALDLAFLSADSGAVEIALLARFLYARWQAKLPCPALLRVNEFARPGDGEALREALLALARSWGEAEAFAAWLAPVQGLLAESLSGPLSAAEAARAQHEMNYKDAFIGWAEPQLSCTIEGTVPEALKAVLSGGDFALACDRKTRVFDALVFLCAPAGYLMGKESFAQVLQDETLRAWIGAAFFEEILPSLPWSREEISPYVISSFGRLENSMNHMPLLEIGCGLLHGFPRTLLPAIRAWADREFEAPPKISLAFAAAIMLYAGARRGKSGQYEVLRGQESHILSDDAEILEAFSLLAHDVPAETLAYAVLADRTLWGMDLRNVDGLEQRVSSDLSAIQRIGFKGALDARR